ncbi:MAG: 4'-phosphopantetheinyl transferase family protein, partial [Chloroflexota bacterium]
RRGLPAPVGVGIRCGSDGVLPALYLAEERCLGPNAAERRRFFFALGRAAARDALAELGVAAVAIRRGSAGEPVWPDGIVGAITHTGDLAVAIAGWRSDYAGLGVDLEQLSPGLSARAARLVCTPLEMAWVGEAGASSRATLLFSAKEAVFKALYPIERIWLGFGDAELEWHADRSAFEAHLLKCASASHPAGSRLQVASTLTDAQVLSTTYALPAAAPARPT